MSTQQIGSEKKLMAESPERDAGSESSASNKVIPLKSNISEKSPLQFVDVLGSEKTPLRTMFSYSNRRCCQITGGFVMLLLGSVANFAVPGLLGMVVDAITKKDWARIDQLALFMLIIVVVSGIASGIRGSLFNITSFGIARDIRYDLFYALIRKDVGYFDETKTGELLSRMSSDTEVVQAGLSVNFSMLFRAVIFIIVSIVILALISWKLTLVTVGGIIPFALFAICMGIKMRVLSKELQDKKSELAQASEEAISNIRTVKAFASEKNETQKFAELNKEVYDIGLSLALVGACFAFLTGLLFNGMYSVIVYYGSYLARDGEITIGEITAFLLYMIQLVFNFAIISFTFSNLFKMSGASEKIVAIMQQVPAVNYGGGVTIPADQVVGEIELKDVMFEYPTKKDVQICKNVSMKVKKNQVVALVGPSGCGKSSIISLIERFYDPIKGQVFFSGVDVKELDARWYKRQIAIVSQEPVLFSGSIRENICYGLEIDEVSDEQLRDACRKANALNFIMDKSIFPDGFDTLVGERGIKLSGGQKQRVAIARALIRKPKLLLLDEATSALDAESEHLVQKALDELIKLGLQTVICIAHRLSTIRDADVIMVMKSGEIVERGSHNELMQIEEGVYKALISRQLQGQKNGMSASPVRESEQVAAE